MIKHIAIISAFLVPTSPIGQQQEEWVADFQSLTAGMAVGYANLDWQISHRSMDLASLKRSTEENLRNADTPSEAMRVINGFIGAFDDPHLKFAEGAPPSRATLIPLSRRVDETPHPENACGLLGYEQKDYSTKLSYRESPEYEPIAEGPFPTGITESVGFLRIADFREEKYLKSCINSGSEATDKFALRSATRSALNTELRGALASLVAVGATKLVIDVTGNGGGSDWSKEAAAIFGRGTMVRYEMMSPDPRCDRTAVWQNRIDCPLFAGEPALDQMEGEAIWPGDIVILADRYTASATEDFIAWLADNELARIAGEKTKGAGYGYWNGGNAVVLKSLNAHVMMPNCIRLRLDGTNEVEGIEPDIALQLDALTAEEMANALHQAFQ